VRAQSTPPTLPAKFALPSNPIELTRAARPNVYFDAANLVTGNYVFNLDTVLRRKLVIEISIKGGIEIDVLHLPIQLGNRTTSLKILDVAALAPNRLALRIEGLAGRKYTLRTRGGHLVQEVAGGVLKGEEGGWRQVEVTFPAADHHDHYQIRTLELRLKEPGRR
jgi:hypothetical protein